MTIRQAVEYYEKINGKINDARQLVTKINKYNSEIDIYDPFRTEMSIPYPDIKPLETIITEYIEMMRLKLEETFEPEKEEQDAHRKPT